MDLKWAERPNVRCGVRRLSLFRWGEERECSGCLVSYLGGLNKEEGSGELL